MRVIVTGSREMTDRYLVWDVLTEVLREANALPGDGPILTVVHGDALGADRCARQWAEAHDPIVVNEPHPADWKMGKQAGHWRNQHMVNLGADLVLAFFQPGAANRGTADCVRRAEEAGIPVRRYPLEPTPAEWAALAKEPDDVPALTARRDALKGNHDA